MKEKIFGTDWGRTLKRWIPNESRNSLENPKPSAKGYLRVKPFAGALETLQWVKENGFSSVHLVSKVDMQSFMEQRIRRWLRRHGFESVIPPEQMHFCEEMHEKLPICQRIGITHFVDDRLEVLRHMIGHVENLFLFCPRTAEDLHLWYLVEDKKVTWVKSWHEVKKQVLSQS